MARTNLTSPPAPSQAADLDGAAPGGAPPADDREERRRQRAARRGTEVQTPDQPPVTAARTPGVETHRARFARKAHRSRLHLYAFAAVVVLVYAVALAATNTGRVHVNWVFGSSSVALVWLVLFTGILGWVLGILITALFRWRTRAPRPS